MNLLTTIRERFRHAIEQLAGTADEYLALIRPAQDAKFGDYQANFAMSLKKVVGRDPRAIAADLVATVELSDLCQSVEVAGPGFINLRLKDELLAQLLQAAVGSDRLGILPTLTPKTFVVDFSSPNVAKPMHVGHIRSTFIGDCLSRVLRFVGHRVITDNHLGDWGTQFGMIIYGYKHFCNPTAYQTNPVGELSRLYRLVRSLIDYRESLGELPKLEKAHEQLGNTIAQFKQQTISADKAQAKQQQKELQAAQAKAAELHETLESCRQKIAKIQKDADMFKMANQHEGIAEAVLRETAELHAGNEENVRLWHQFLPHCREDIQRIYRRLDIHFDYELGESFYHDRLGPVVDQLISKGLARESDGAMCVFMDGFETPMIVRKKDGAYLYATTDLATVEYRMEQWHPNAILYVVDHRQGEHFDKFFAAVRLMGYRDVILKHVSFGTVLGEDGTPFKTRAGDTVGLEGLLDEAERKAAEVLRQISSERDSELPPDQQTTIARRVGLGALKFADLSQHRASDYKFSYDKMLELKGFTATYLQYLFARVQGIYRKESLNPEQWRKNSAAIVLETPLERELGLHLLRFHECLDDVLLDYRPNILAQYLFELTQIFFRFYSQCSVLNADSAALRQSRLQLCDLTARTVELGLQLMGIAVVDEM